MGSKILGFGYPPPPLLKFCKLLINFLCLLICRLVYSNTALWVVSQSREILTALSLPFLASRLKYSAEYGVYLAATLTGNNSPDAKNSCLSIGLTFCFYFSFDFNPGKILLPEILIMYRFCQYNIGYPILFYPYFSKFLPFCQ